ncbi:MAG: hypothetical protein IGS03_11955, partial [Candidatus Sericytochromatia bacterium]|nr:hypothetical protein [Candidatus Sericytochromatia bacterium]
MKKLLTLLMLVLCLGSTRAAQAQSSPRMLLNNQLLSIPQLPFTQQNVLYLPIQVVEHLGFQLKVDPVSQ